MEVDRAICVYAGSQPGARPEYVAAAQELGRLIARSGRRLVFGGGRRGLMGAVADAALAEGGEVVGIIPAQLYRAEVGHEGVSELVVVDSMHERKREMADRADAFVALPGGVGTVEELVEIWTWTHLGYQDKPCGVLNVLGYWEHFARFFDHASAEGFLAETSRGLLLVSDDPADLLARVDAASRPEHQRLIRPDLL